MQRIVYLYTDITYFDLMHEVSGTVVNSGCAVLRGIFKSVILQMNGIVQEASLI